MIGLGERRVKKSRLSLTKIKKIYSDINKKEIKLKKEKKTFSQDVIGAIERLIKQNPYIESVRWTQYTPHYNDGEECVFSVNDIEFLFSNKAKNYLQKSWRVEEYIPLWQINDLIKDSADIINSDNIENIQSIIFKMDEMHDKLKNMEEQLLEIFGDHARVAVHKDGIEVIQYEHD